MKLTLVLLLCQVQSELCYPMLVASCLHPFDAGNHAENHFCGIHKLAGAAHLLSNNQLGLLHLDDPAGIFQESSLENLQDSGAQMNKVS